VTHKHIAVTNDRIPVAGSKITGGCSMYSKATFVKR